MFFLMLCCFIFTGEHIAAFYLDPYARPSEKRGGAWMDSAVGEYIVYRIYLLTSVYTFLNFILNEP